MLNSRDLQTPTQPLLGSNLNDCPLKEARSENRKFFRLMKDGILKAENFKSRAKLGRGNKEICAEHAVSLTLTEEQAKEMRKKFPYFAKSRIAVIEIKNTHGVVHCNRPDHANWWHHENFDPTSISTLLNEDHEVANNDS